jgi:hypothetical protein
MILAFLQQFNVIVRSAYHYQIPLKNDNGQTLNGQYHNIWTKKDGRIKILLYGENQTKWINDVDELREIFKNYRIETTRSYEFGLKAALGKAKGDGLFVDASYNDKTRIGRICVFKKYRDNLEIHCRKLHGALNVQYCEQAAIILAKEKYPNEKIFTDCQTLANGRDVIWIRRNLNSEADKLVRMLA